MFPFFGFAAATAYAQEGQSPYHRLVEGARAEGWIREGEAIKCGTALLFGLMADQTGDMRSAFKEGLRSTRPIRQTSRISASGMFRVHYDTSGVNTPAMLDPGTMEPIPGTYEQYVDSVMAAADYSLVYLTSILKFEAPPNDGTRGGGPEYDIYLENLGVDGFGMTLWDEPLTTTPNQKFVTYMVLENDFYGNRTSGLAGLRVTVAHELHHAIQVGAYGVWVSVPNSDFYFYEATSTWIESVVFPSVDDYLFEARRYFTQFRDIQGRSLSMSYYPARPTDPFFPGYERIVWIQYLERRFGRDVVRRIWDGLKLKPYLRSLTELLEGARSSVEAEVARFSVWNYFTADRADTVQSYLQGNLYPRFQPNVSVRVVGGSGSVSFAAYPLSTQMIELTIGSDTVTAVVANVDIARVQSSALYSLQPLKIGFSFTPISAPSQVLQKGGAVSFEGGGESQYWRVAYLAASTDAIATNNDLPSPNPFLLNGTADLVIPVTGIADKEVDVSIYSIAMDRLFSRTYYGRNYFGREELAIPVNDVRGTIPSGIHILVASYDGQTHWWKVAFVK